MGSTPASRPRTAATTTGRQTGRETRKARGKKTWTSESVAESSAAKVSEKREKGNADRETINGTIATSVYAETHLSRRHHTHHKVLGTLAVAPCSVSMASVASGRQDLIGHVAVVSERGLHTTERLHIPSAQYIIQIASPIQGHGTRKTTDAAPDTLASSLDIECHPIADHTHAGEPRR